MIRAYSYVRFSSAPQEQGDSLRRQTALAQQYCEQHKLILDDSLRLRDLGVSAYKGDNVRDGALAAFLHAIKLGKVAKGSCLLVESLDRLTREQIGDALSLFISILNAGVNLVTLKPERLYTKESIQNVAALLEPIVIMAMAHEESQKKSFRLGSVWKQKKLLAAQGKVLTARTPSWVTVKSDNSGFDLLQQAVAVVRRIFDMALAGYGIRTICKTLNSEGVPAIGHGKSGWQPSYIKKVLSNRAVSGEYQPYTGRAGKRKPVGDPIPNYYPCIIPEADFYRVQTALKSRVIAKGRPGKGIKNLFTGLIRDARDGQPMNLVDKSGKKSPAPRLVSSGAMRGVNGSRYLSVSYPEFEQAFLRTVKELKSSDILPQTPSDAEDRINTASGRLLGTNHRIEQIKAKLADPDSPIDTLFDVLNKLEADKKALIQELDKAKSEVVNGEAEILGNCQSLFAVLENAAPAERADLRLRLKQAIRNLVKAVCVCCWTDKFPWEYYYRDRTATFRFAFVDIAFTSGLHRWFIMEQKSGLYVGWNDEKAMKDRPMNHELFVQLIDRPEKFPEMGNFLNVLRTLVKTKMRWDSQDKRNHRYDDL